MRTLKMAAIAAALGGFTLPASAAVIQFNNFSSSAGLTINGTAATATDGSSRNVLRVTNANFNQGGSAFSTSTANLASNASFSTRFQFNFNSQGFGGADGLVFALQTVGNNVGGIGGGIGYQGIPNSVGIEFDNWNNGGIDGDNDNHVGIDINGDVNSVARNDAPGFNFDTAGDLWAWIDYNGATDTLEVRLNDSDSRPGAAILSYVVDIASILGSTNAYVGFTSGTGAAYANHDVISWEFRDTFDPIDVPEPGSLALTSLALLGLAAATRRRARKD